mmetsp:Transcript_34094/g.49465  ORF Transcript_34094/g.49465 Transcript_34094/m.49465 type:complete len:87 (+) Transcript_34094:1639-1899(+)
MHDLPTPTSPMMIYLRWLCRTLAFMECVEIEEIRPPKEMQGLQLNISESLGCGWFVFSQANGSILGVDNIKMIQKYFSSCPTLSNE